MNFFKKFKTYLVESKPKHQFHQLQGSQNLDSFELIVADILQNQNNSDYFEELVLPQNQVQKQQIENVYLKQIFVEKCTQGRQLTLQQWKQIIDKNDISLQPKKNIYLSILKGIDFTVKNVWQLLANVNEMKKITKLTYKELKNPLVIIQCQLTQIDKDVPRTKAVTKFLPELRNILIAYVNLSKKSYIQGMNLIGGCLLQLLSLQNDKELNSFDLINQQEFQQRVFWVFVGIMKYKRWEELFVKDMSGLTKMLDKLGYLMAEHVPSVYQKIVDFQWDLTIFSQYYLTIMIYNTPKKLSQIILDLFLVDGQSILHSLIIRIMKIQQDKIISFDDEGELMAYFKSGILNDCLYSIQKQQKSAKKLEDFQINFFKSAKM